MDRFITWVLSRAGLTPCAYRPQPLHRRIPACLRALKVTSTSAAREKLEQDPRLLATAVSALLIGVTEFFRDPSVFESIRTGILPGLAARKKNVRIWSVACSSGAELYSMAILLSEAGLLEGSFLLGTDCRGDAIEQARAGLYEAGELQFLDPSLRSRYFLSHSGLIRPVEALRNRIIWKTADVLNGPEQGPWDIILWRNVAIYLEPKSAAAIWNGFVPVLAPGGVLVAGKAERPPASVYRAGSARCLYHTKEKL